MTDFLKNRYTIFALIIAVFMALFVLLYHEVLTGARVVIHDSIVFYGIVHYYFESLSHGIFPYWDPYMTTGTYFYPNAPVQGLLDPTVLFAFIAVKALGLSPLTGYIYLMLLRLFITVIGAFYLFRHITKDQISSLIAAGVFLLAIPLSYMQQMGVIAHLYLTPFALYCLLLFLEAPSGPKRNLALFCLVFIVGVGLNIYIPAHFLFNIIVVLIAALTFKCVNLRDIVSGLKVKKDLALHCMAAVLLMLMASLPVLVMYFDASGSGELFPMQRIIQKNNRVFKKIMASETGTANLSSKFTHEQAVFFSTGNLVELVYPDLVRSFKYWNDNDLMSEIHQYIGIIPLILAIIGMLYHKTRYRPVFLIALALMFINGYSFDGAHDKPFNVLHNILNTLFPPLSMLQGRQNFGYFVLLYLCLFACMGLSLIRQEKSIMHAKYRQIIAVALALIAVKIVITGYYAERFLVISVHDAFTMFEIILIAILVYAAGRKIVPLQLALSVFFLATLIDLGMYNAIYRNEITQKGESFYAALTPKAISKDRPEEFQYFREPFVHLSFDHPLAFEESIAKRKGALSYGFNHSFFTTKRYYDFLTHIPLQNQFVLNGTVYPILQFFPKDLVVPIMDRKKLLEYYAIGDPATIAEKLYIEEQTVAPMGTKMKDLSQHEDVPELNFMTEIDAYDAFYRANETVLRSIRSNLDRFLHNPQASIEVVDFSSNDLSLHVINTVDGYVYYNDGWSKYWRAFDNNREIPVYIANYNFKAVFLEKGEHRVRFVFDPVHYKVGLLSYYMGMTVSVISLLYMFISGRRLLPKAIRPEDGNS